VTGHGADEGYGYDFITMKYNPNGVQQWIKRYSSGKENSHEPVDLAIDNKGDIYVTGNVFGGENDFVIIKYNSLGKQQWLTEYRGTNAKVHSVAMDGWGNLYIAARNGYRQNFELIMLKYNPDGIQQWEKHFKKEDYIFSNGNISVDVLGNVHVAGYFWKPYSENWNFITLKYNTKGIKQWETHYEGEGIHGDVKSLVLDRESNVYIAGDIWTADMNSEMVILKYDSVGSKKWTASYNDPRNVQDLCKAMVVDNQGDIYIAGSTTGRNWSYFKTIKFSQTGDDSLITNVIAGYELNQNFPNPYKKQTLIYYNIPKASHVKIKVFNQIGQQVTIENLGIQVAGKHAYHFRTDNLGSGVYFYQLNAGDFVKTMKMVVIQ